MQHLSCLVEFVFTEEDARCLASKFFNLIIKLRWTDEHVTAHAVHIQVLLGQELLHHFIYLIHKLSILRRKRISYVFCQRISLRTLAQTLTEHLHVLQLRLDERFQISRIKRFGDISHSPQFQAIYLVVHARHRCNQDHRNMAEREIPLQHLAEFQSRHISHDNITQDDIWLHLFQIRQSLFGRIAVHHFVIRRKEIVEVISYIHIIIYNQDSRQILTRSRSISCKRILHSSLFILHFQRNLHHMLLLSNNLHLIIYRLIGRKTETELHTIP